MSNDKIIKQFCKDMEVKGFLTTPRLVFYSFDELHSGASFVAKVNVLKYIDNLDPDGSRYPRLRNKFKEGRYEITVVKTTDEFHHHYTMDTQTIDLNEGDKPTDEIEELIDNGVEGGEFIDKLCELQKIIRDDAREQAKALFNKLEVPHGN